MLDAVTNDGANRKKKMTKHFTPTHARTADDLMHVREFLNVHGVACVNVALILGGQRSHARTVGLVAKIQEAVRLSRHLKYELVHLHRLLTLDHVGNPDAEETAFFVEIDPSDPLVGDICLLSDRLRDVLEMIDRHDSDPAAADGASSSRSAA